MTFWNAYILGMLARRLRLSYSNRRIFGSLKTRSYRRRVSKKEGGGWLVEHLPGWRKRHTGSGYQSRRRVRREDTPFSPRNPERVQIGAKAHIWEAARADPREA